MPMYSVSDRVLPTSTSRLEGEIIFILVTLRSMISSGRSNSPTMQRGMAPPQGLQLSSLRSIMMVSMPAWARVSAAHAPEGPPPMTATLRGRSSFLPAARTWREPRPCLGAAGAKDAWRALPAKAEPLSFMAAASPVAPAARPTDATRTDEVWRLAEAVRAETPEKEAWRVDAMVMCVVLVAQGWNFWVRRGPTSSLSPAPAAPPPHVPGGMALGRTRYFN
mmetsp:Transcript_24514/g.77483  ORF Transcript_24514/g.77483 Transcript_24514/m.77483 type:complete len:221 (+) Transcript_24514:1072-1734(+)